MGKGIGHHAAPALLLQTIVADGVGGAERFFQIAGVENVLGFLSVMGPDAGEKISLQFHADGKLVVLGLIQPFALCMDLFADA